MNNSGFVWYRSEYAVEGAQLCTDRVTNPNTDLTGFNIRFIGWNFDTGEVLYVVNVVKTCNVDKLCNQQWDIRLSPDKFTLEVHQKRANKQPLLSHVWIRLLHNAAQNMRPKHILCIVLTQAILHYSTWIHVYSSTSIQTNPAISIVYTESTNIWDLFCTYHIYAENPPAVYTPHKNEKNKTPMRILAFASPIGNSWAQDAFQ